MVGNIAKGLLVLSMSVIVLLIIAAIIEVPHFIYGQSLTESKRVEKVIVDTPLELDNLDRGDTFSVVTPASNGTVFKNHTEVTYFPNKSFIGKDSFVYNLTVNNITTKTSVSVAVVPEPIFLKDSPELRSALAFIIAFIVVTLILYSASIIVKRDSIDSEKKVRKTSLRKFFYEIVLDENWYPSLALFQFLLWTFIIVFAFLGIYLTRIFGGYSGIPVEIPVNLLLVMGISVSVPIITSKASNIKYKSSTISRERPDPPHPLSGMLKENDKITLTRFQMFSWTWIGIMVYLFILFSTVVTTDNITKLGLPDLPNVFVVLMGISQGSYLGGKFVMRQDMEITKISPQTQQSGKPISIYGSNFGNAKETIWIGNVRIRGEDKEGNKDIIENWLDDRIDIIVPKSVPAGEYEVKIGRGGVLVTSGLKLKVNQPNKGK